MTWPVKPKGIEENDWYREIEQDLVLSVLSADPEARPCPTCGGRRIVYQHQDLKSRQIVALCKDCTLAKAGGPEKLWVRTGGTLRETWERDARNSDRGAAGRQGSRHRNEAGGASGPGGVV